MSYMHIENLYRPKGQRILLFKRVHIMEKVHGMSARIHWKDGLVHVSHASYMNDSPSTEELKASFKKLGHANVTVFGEAYGGSQQRMSKSYGLVKRFIAFEVKISDLWLAVPQAADVATKLGLEFVPWYEVACELSELDTFRDLSSEVAIRRGINDVVREGIVIRPTMELVGNDGERIIAKHKNAVFAETTTLREVVDPDKLQVLSDAEAIALEWVTDRRLEHVLQKASVTLDIRATKSVIDAMVEDVIREGEGEIVDTKEARAAISARTATLYKSWLKKDELGK